MSFLIKLFLNGVIAIPMLMWLADIPFFTAFVTAVLLAIVAYFIGDRFVLPESFNAFATYVDALLSFGFLWWASALFDWDLIASEALAIAVVIGLAEVLFHRYLRNEGHVEAEPEKNPLVWYDTNGSFAFCTVNQ